MWQARKLVFPKLQEILLIFLSILLLGVVGMLLPGGSDWYLVVRPAALQLLAGNSPYDQPFWYSPVWILLPFVPLAVLPPLVGRAALFIISVCAYGYSMYKMGARTPALIAFLVSPSIITALWLNSTDWIPFLGYVLPPQIGLFLLAAKPQLGLGVALFWLVEAARKGWREVARVFAPVGLALLLLVMVYGVEPFLVARRLITVEHNTSLWPMSLPFGLGLLMAAWRKRDLRYAIAASPCFSPYMMITTWAALFLAIAAATPELIVAVIGAWIMALLQAM